MTLCEITFYVFASLDNHDKCFKIKTLEIEHTCSVTYKNRRANFKYIGKHFLKLLKIVPNLKLVEMQRLAKEELMVVISTDVAWRGRKWGIDKIRGKVEYEFSKLYDYVATLRELDPNGSFDLVVAR